MTNNSTTSLALQSEGESVVHLLDDWFDPIEAGLRDRVREFIQAMIERLFAKADGSATIALSSCVGQGST